MESNLFSNFEALTVAYINHEGTELPLKNVKDFNDAIRSAKWKGKNHLKLIFYDHRLKADEAAALNKNKFIFIGRFPKSQKVPMPDTNTVSNNFSQCSDSSFPEWFEQYKKCKKEIIKDLKTSVREIIQEEFEKRKKLDEVKLFKLLRQENEFPTPKKLKKKKKLFVKDSFDLLEKGETKLLKKIEKHHSSIFDRMIVSDSHLEKLVNKTRTDLDEKRNLLEKIHQIKLRETNKTLPHVKKSMKKKKSAIFHQSDVFLFLQPAAEFLVTVNILNNGAVPWVSPRMECFDTCAVCLEKPIIKLPRLEPGQSVNATLKGKVSKRLGNYYFAYKFFDGLEEFRPLLWWFPIVSGSKKDVINNSGQLKLEKIAIPTGSLEAALVNSKKDKIGNSQKKVEENMIEIERRLKGLNVSRFCTSSNKSSLNNNPGDFKVMDCNALQDEEKKFRVEKGEMIFGVDFLKQQEETEKTKLMDANVTCKNLQTDKYGRDGDSDSELSIVVLEEDESFIFVPCSSESLSSEALNNSTKLPEFDLNKECNRAKQKPKKDVQSHPLKVELKEVGSKESNTYENCLSSRLVTEEEGFSKKAEPSIKSIFISTTQASGGIISNDSTKENVPGDVSFTTFKEKDGLHGTLSSILKNTLSRNKSVSHSEEEVLFSGNTKSGGKTNPMWNTKTSNIARKRHRINVPTTDCVGRPIYAVRKDGYCLPIKELI